MHRKAAFAACRHLSYSRNLLHIAGSTLTSLKSGSAPDDFGGASVAAASATVAARDHASAGLSCSRSRPWGARRAPVLAGCCFGALALLVSLPPSGCAVAGVALACACQAGSAQAGPQVAQAQL